MELSRRQFLKVAGLGVLGLAGMSVFGRLVSRRVGAVPGVSSLLTTRRWAMVIDIKACAEKKGCTDCIVACHSTHNVPDLGNIKDEIKWIWEAPYQKVFPEQELLVSPQDLDLPVLLMCNHCDDPPCIKVCPTKATWRREDGIVMVDYHRCIGCRYCMAGCPYGARSFNWKDPRPYIKEPNPDYPTRMRGVVEKCNFCEERLAQGLMPKCVEACPEHALTFGDLNDPASGIADLIGKNRVTRRLPELGTKPNVYYII